MIILNTLFNKLHRTISADYVYFSSDNYKGTFFIGPLVHIYRMRRVNT